MQTLKIRVKSIGQAINFVESILTSNVVLGVSDDLDVKVYPNLTSDYVLIEGNSPLEEIALLDLNGPLLETKIEGNKVYLSLLEDGAYMLEVKTKREEISLFRILKIN